MTMTKLKEGMKAPDFEGIIETGEKIRLSDYHGKYVVLFFYPAAETYGCTREACGFRDHHEELIADDVEVIGVSVDPVEKQRRFKERYHLPYHLVADVTKEISRQYSGLGLLGRANRVTFLIGPDGTIMKIWKMTGLFSQLNLKKHSEDVKKTIERLKQETLQATA